MCGIGTVVHTDRLRYFAAKALLQNIAVDLYVSVLLQYWIETIIRRNVTTNVTVHDHW